MMMMNSSKLVSEARGGHPIYMVGTGEVDCYLKFVAFGTCCS